LVYGLILLMDWQLVRYFLTQTGAPAIVWLIVIAIITVLLLTSLQYIQQSLWARQYYYASLRAVNSNELLYMEKPKPASLWPLGIMAAGVITITFAYFLITSLYASQLRGYLANLHSVVPSEIRLVVPLKK